MGFSFWPQAQYDALPADVRAARAVLEDWFRAMEDGTVTARMPDPLDTSVAMEAADRVIAALDEEFQRELRSWAMNEGTDGGPYTDGPGFDRLAPSQRLALAQALRSVFPRAQTP